MDPLKMVVVPCYNEADRLDLPAFDALLTAGIGLIFVDDGSTDATQAMLTDYTAGHPDAELLVQPENRGKGEAVRVGMRQGLEHGAEVGQGPTIPSTRTWRVQTREGLLPRAFIHAQCWS